MEVCPSRVIGWYAPPVKLYPHLAQLQMPALTRFTALLAQLGHLWGLLMVLVILVHRFLTELPPLVLSLRP